MVAGAVVLVVEVLGHGDNHSKCEVVRIILELPAASDAVSV